MKSKTNFPVIILFEPQLEENIGAVARAMLNFNFHNIRIIKKGWKPTKVSFKNSAKADEILKKAEVFTNLEDAINDLHYVFATSNRKRDLNTDIVNLKKGARIINNYKNFLQILEKPALFISKSPLKKYSLFNYLVAIVTMRA